MTIGEGRETSRGLEIAGVDVIIDRAAELLEGVGEPFVVPTRIAGERANVGLEQRRIADEQLVGAVAIAEPKLVGPFAVQGKRAFAAGDLETQAILAAGGDLRDGADAARAALKAEQD